MSDLLQEAEGFPLLGPGAEGHSTLSYCSTEETFIVGRQHLQNNREGLNRNTRTPDQRELKAKTW